MTDPSQPLSGAAPAPQLSRTEQLLKEHDEQVWAELHDDDGGGYIRIDLRAACRFIEQHVMRRKFDNYNVAILLRRLSDKAAEGVVSSWPELKGSEVVEKLIGEEDARNKR